MQINAITNPTIEHVKAHLNAEYTLSGPLKNIASNPNTRNAPAKTVIVAVKAAKNL